MRGLSTHIAALLLLATAVGPAAPTLSAQGTGTVRGRILDAATQAPLPAVQVRVEGTPISARTNEEGRFTLTGVPATDITVTALRIGYNRVSRSVRIAAGQLAALDFELTSIPIGLEQVVVTATGAQRRREVGNAIAVIDAAVAVDEAPITNVAELLTGRAAGVQVLQSSGTTGMGSRIRIRGSNSVSLSNEPIIYVDGVRISNDNSAVTYETGGDAPSRLNDLAPEQIETIEVVKGPSAATLYGTDAANGVVWITTKRGRAGETRWNFYTEQGTVTDPYTYPASYRGLTATGQPCRLFDVATSTCTQARLASLSPLEHDHTSPFRTGKLQHYGLSVSGGQDQLRYFLSSDMQNEDGVLPTNALDRVNVRGNFDTRLARNLDAAVSIGYLKSNLKLPLNGNYELGVIGNGLASQGSEDVLGGWGFFPLEQLLVIESSQDIRRFNGSARFIWNPRSFLTGRLTVGLDEVGRTDDQFFPTGVSPAWLGYDQGARFANRFQGSTYTADAVSTARFRLRPSLSSQTSLGLQYIREVFTGTLAGGRQLVAGSRSISAAAIRESSEQTTENIKLGAFVEEQLAFRDRIFVTGALRADDNSAFGKDFDLVVYPKFSASWVVSEERFFPRVATLGSLRLRAAWGTSGLQPGPTDALRFFDPVPVTVGGTSVTGVTFGSLGNPTLRPERSGETELGFDAQFAGERLGLEMTYYNKKTSDALIFRQLPPSLGVSRGRFENLGSVRNSGLEALVAARIFDSPRAAWHLTVNGATNTNELVSLGEGIPPIIFGVQRHVVGYPLGGYWDQPIVGFSDANGDGIIAESEVQLGADPVFLGTPFPKRQLSIRNDVTLLSRVRLGALFDFRGGQKLYNSTESWRALQNITRSLNDPATPLADQARAVASARLGSEAGYVEDASFWKLREVSLTFMVPERWTQRVNSQKASLTLAGRNLATWSDYSGLDPEVNQTGQTNFTTSDFMGQPPVRYWTARLNLSF